MRTARVIPSLLLFLGIAVCAQADPGYLLTVPSVLSAGSEEKFCLTIHGLEEEQADFTLVLTHSIREDVTYEYQHSFSEDENQCRDFRVPQETGFYEVTLENEAGVVSPENTLSIEVRGENQMTFVQTDKPLYKAGQLVRFRILTLKRDLRPREGMIDSVYIKDPNDLRVKQWQNIDSAGLHDLEFQLVAEPKLGTWTIEVTLDEATTQQTFKVDEYVLPKFDVKITPPSFFLANASTIEGKVCAQYTYGKPVAGHLLMDVCLQGYGSFERPCAHVVEEIYGCYQFSVNTSELAMSDRRFYLHGSKVHIAASVRERDTGSQVNETSEGPFVTFDPLTISLEDDTNGYFKPVFPYHGRAIVTLPDGSPAVKELIEISVVDYKNDVRLSSNYTTDKDGKVYFAVCGKITAATASFSVEARAVMYAEDLQQSLNVRLYMPRDYDTIKQWYSPTGSYISIPRKQHSFRCGEEVQLDIPYTAVPNTTTTFYYQVLSRGRIVESGHSTQPFSRMATLETEDESLCLKEVVEPSPEPPILEPPILEPPILEPPILEPPFPEEIPDSPPEEGGAGPEELETEMAEEPVGREPVEEELIVPEVFNPLEIRRRRETASEGKVPEDTMQEKQELSHFRLKLRLQAEMSPKASLLVYYIREDGETVADSISFNVEPCFNNKVGMEFVEKSVMPGEEASIRLTADSGSLCAVGVVDRSINILGGDHQLTPAKVFDKLQSFNLNNHASSYAGDSKYCEKKVKEQEEKEAGEKAGEEAMRSPSYRWFLYTSRYVDALQAFKQTGVAVLTNLVLETRPCSKEYPVFYDYGPSMPVPLSLEVPEAVEESVDASVGRSPSAAAPVRHHFPETWLWELELIADGDDVLVLKRKAPHTITKWVGNSMCVNPRTGFGISNMTSLTTFQPFFLSFTLPYAAVRGERLPIRISVFNYLDKCLNMQLQLETTEAIMVHNARKFPFCVCGGQAHTKRFYITAEDIGTLPLKAMVEVIPGTCGNSVEMSTEYIGLRDAVERKLFVKAEGVTQEYVRSSYMCPGGSKKTEMMDLPLPRVMVPDSARGHVTVVGDIMGPALSNLDHLVQQPTGCGEQTMVTFTPIVHVLQYLSATQQLTQEMSVLATQYLEIGYQRELTFRHDDGSFSAFGKSDSSGSTWLTAFVVKSFAQARPFMFVDPEDLEQSISFLRSIQLENGCFREVGRVFSSYMMGGLGKKTGEEEDDTALTAFVLVSLLEANVSKEDPMVESAFQCMDLQGETTDPYTLAIVAYAQTLRSPSSASSKAAMKALNKVARKDESLKYWSRKTEIPKPVSTWFYHAAPSAEVEMTAYALMAVLQHHGEEAVAKGQPIVLWLSRQRNAFGGFASTQDTVVGLHALGKFAAKIHTDKKSNISLSINGKNFSRTFEIVNGVNSLLTQVEPISVLSNVLVVKAEGDGCALVQASVRYNRIPEKPVTGEDAFNLTLRTFSHNDDCAQRSIRICVSYTDKGKFSTGMSLVNMKLVTGWRPIQQSLRELRSVFPILNMKRYEHDEEKGELNFYFDEMDQRDRCFDLKMEQDQDHAVSNPKPAEVQAYQYYEKEVTVVETYELKTTCGTKEEIPREPVEEPRLGEVLSNQPAFPVQVRQGSDRPRGVNAASTFPQPEEMDCPICTTEKPDNFDQLICNSTVVYKVIAGRNGKVPMKVKANLRPRRKKKLDLFVKYDMGKKCPCFLVKPPNGKRVKRLLILSKKEILSDDQLSLKSHTILLSLDNNRSLEKLARKAARSCHKKSRSRRP